MAQFGRPDSNVTQTNVTGGFTAIDEAVASNADFAYSANNTTGELEVGLSDVTDPAVSTGHVVRYRYAKTNAGAPDSGGSDGTLQVRLLQGVTGIAASGVFAVTSGTWTAGSFTLSGAEADAITDYADLRLQFDMVGGGGSPSSRRGVGVSWAELEVPDAAAPKVTGAVAVTATATVATSGVRTIRSAISAVATATPVVAARLTLRSAVSATANATVAVAGSVGAVVTGAVSAVAAASASVTANVRFAAAAAASSQAVVAIGGAVKRGAAVAVSAGGTVLTSARTILRSGVSANAAASVTVTASGTSAAANLPICIRRSQSAVVGRLGNGNFSVN